MQPGRRIRVFVGGVAVMVSATVAAFLALQTTTPTTGNLWVDANGGTCTREATPAAYSDAAACDHDEAYQAAEPGDNIVVKSADYGTVQFKERDTPMTSPGAVFHIEAGTQYATLNIGYEVLSNGCLPVAVEQVDWLTMTGDKGTWDAEFLMFANATNITVDGIVVDRELEVGKAVFWAGSTSDTTLRNAYICCNFNAPLMESWIGDVSYTANANITLEDSFFGRMRRDSVLVHNECFLAGGVPGLTIARTRWSGCNVMNFNFGGFGPGAAITQSDFHFVNNIFESPTDMTETDQTGFPWFQGCNAPDYDEAPGWVIEYNVIGSGFYDCGGFNGLTLRGNVGTVGNTGCPVGVTYSHNVWASPPCSATDLQVTDLLSNPSAYFGGVSTGEWWLKAGSPAIDAGDPASYPATDRTGLARFTGTAPDAGPNERP